jgi:ABC-type nickel/cobalt efflux system permease component RcnA
VSTVFSLESAKAWVALLGAIVTAVIATVDVVPQWLTVVSAVLTAVGVWLTRNGSPDDTAVEQADDDTEPQE